MNTFGNNVTLTTFGESHGPALGGVLDGIPAGVALDMEQIQRQMARRRPGQSAITTARKEADTVELLSGVFEGRTTGTPIGFIIRNSDQHSADYDNLRHVFRPSHADYTYFMKYGVRDHRGGGRSSARETAVRVAAGAIAMQVLATRGISVCSYTSQVGDIRLDKPYAELDLAAVDSNAVRCPDADTARRMIALIEQVKREGDTVGGVVTGVIRGLRPGVGEPMFDKLQARLAYAMLSINAAKGFDYGMGFDGVGRRGSQMNDAFVRSSDPVRPLRTATNHSGGIQGGISNGEDVYFRVAFKPVATLLRPMSTFDDEFRPVTVQPRGRHDACVLPRAVPVVDAMAALVTLDLVESMSDNAKM